MSKKFQIVKATKKIFKQLTKQFFSAIKKQIIWLLRTFFIPRRRRGSVNAGFVLPTVVMVSIVVVLLTAAILFRSFERSKNASNVRVNEVVIKAASPALDRAKAKVDELFKDPRLPRSTPSDLSLSQVINDNINQYTFGDETQLKLVKDINSDGTIDADGETLKTVWKYPVDTDNNGKFDSFTIYGIYFRTPPATTSASNPTPTPTRPRSSLEARTQPMDEGATANKCISNVLTSADLVGSQGWYKVGSKLKRSIFVYTTTVPITDITTPVLDNTKYEKFTGNKGFAALEYQQDRERIPLSNNAVVYDDDLEIAPGAGLKLNGRVFTNGNLLTKRPGSNEVRFYLVSSPKSCYFTEENNKIVVAGNVINSRVDEAAAGSGVKADLYNQSYDATTITDSILKEGDINNTNKTVPATTYGSTAAYNDEAYARRIDRLVAATNSAYSDETDLPDDVQDDISRTVAADSSLDRAAVREEKLRIYFRKRTRRVPFAEIPFVLNPTDEYGIKYGSVNYKTNSPLVRENKNALRPVPEWVFPFDPDNGTTATGYAEIGVYESSTANKIYLTATDPAEQVKAGKENKIGDRVLVGNNMPQLWYDSTKDIFVSSPDQGQTISGKEWDVKQNGSTNTTVTRKRYSQAFQLDNLGVTDRDDFWEKSAAQKPASTVDVIGGLRVITGAGIYLPDDYDITTKAFTSTKTVVWPDSLPIGVTNQNQGLPNTATPYLRMRATAVYHYQDNPYDPKTPSTYQTPIACVSSFYDPTNSTTAMNQSGLPDVSLRKATPIETRVLTALATVSATTGKSNNGVVYPKPPTAIGDYDAVLQYQKGLTYPNGRLVNEPLKKALDKIAASKSLTLSEQSAVDSAMCALKILENSASFSPTDSAIPHGAIMETAFLDARQIKAIDKPISGSEKTYNLDIELRQPLEIRATVLDLDLLRRKSRPDGEFLFPNSGIIYATRDDALADQSNSTSKDVSATDFKLDPTRRPNGIMLINGSKLSRNDTYEVKEKGLILASNLPVYIQGDFNLHGTHGEFLDDDVKWGIDFYKRKTLNTNFACRKDQFTGCDVGESWRPASVIADAITVLSSNFRLGYRQEGDYDLRDNYGNNALGYDFNGDGSINSATTVSLNEQNLRFDLDGNGTIDSATNVSTTEDQITATVAARLNGFWDNNFVTSRQFDDSKYSSGIDTDTTKNPEGSSYFNNFVTPIQRRIAFSEYVMEICPKLIVTACKPDDWVVGYDLDGNGTFSTDEKSIKANQLLKKLADASITSIQTNKIWAGTTATAPTDSGDTAIQRYPRRVAFLRYGNSLTVKKNNADLNASPTTNALVLDSDNTPVPLGIFDLDNDPATTTDITVRYFPFTNTLTINTIPYSKYATTAATDPPTNPAPNRPRTQTNALWFGTKNGTARAYHFRYPLRFDNTLTGTRTTEQPLLVPVLQIQYPSTSSAQTNGGISTAGDGTSLNWMQRAVTTKTNLVFAQGNTPERPEITGYSGESNGGLENFVRYLETWDLEPGTNADPTNTLIQHEASGSFIQFKRSSYATAPWQTLIVTPKQSTGIFSYRQEYAQTTTNSSDTPFYAAPDRAWGYDVALLTQLPDLFSQRFTSPTTSPPNEFYREVGRDDNWVKTLLCAAQTDTKGYGTADSKYGTGYKYAISSDQRPSCP
jgi:hypothetical protein